MTGPELSVVIPTHERAASLARTLRSLALQEAAPRFEVIVVADACADETSSSVRRIAHSSPFELLLLEHAERNAGATRNFGAARALAPLLLFLDDDIEVAPGFLRAHFENRADNAAVLGYSKPAPRLRPSQWQMEARIWWEDRFREMARPGHRFTYRDFFSGNFSIAADLFARLGGFDPSIGGRLEDYEFGLRLLRSGGLIRFCPEAAGLHRDDTDLEDWIRRIREEGAADVRISTVHPELRPQLFSGEPGNRKERWLRRLAFPFARRGDAVVDLALGLARRLESLRLRKRRSQVVWAARTFNYWRGVSAASGGFAAFERWRSAVAPPAGIAPDCPVYDIAAPPDGDELGAVMARATAEGLRIRLEGIDVTTVPPECAAEPLRPEHIDLIVHNLTRTCFVPAIARQLVRQAGVPL